MADDLSTSGSSSEGDQPLTEDTTPKTTLVKAANDLAYAADVIKSHISNDPGRSAKAAIAEAVANAKTALEVLSAS